MSVPPVSSRARHDLAPRIDAFVRANGEVGVRNDLWVIPLVGAASTALPATPPAGL